MKCAAACPFFAIDTDTITLKKGHPELTCAKCGDCISVCPQKAVSMEFAPFTRGKSACVRPAPHSTFGRILMQLLDPEKLFVFSGYTFGVIMSSSFCIDALNRIFLLISGVFQ
jgi:ferredoxin